MKNISFKNHILPHLISVILFYLIAVWFFAPILKGKTLQQSDVKHGQQVSHQVLKYKEKSGEVAMWNPYIFSGMPAYIFGVKLPGQLLKLDVYHVLSALLSAPTNIVFVMMLCMYILLITYKTNNYIAALGAIAFAFGSFSIISIEFGHNSKISALSFIPLVLAGIKLLWDRKYILGSAVSLLGFVYLINTGHYQIVYYSALLFTIYFVIKGIFSLKEGNLPRFGKTVLFSALVGVGALLSNIGNLWIISDYQSESIRGNQVLQSKKQDLSKSTSGLDRDYAFSWSQGIQESFTLLIHNAYGGGSAEHYQEKDMASYNFLTSRGIKPNQASGLVRQSLYWGDQPFTAGAIYAGATICFFFVLALVFLPRNESIWLAVSLVFFLMLSWGKNFETLNYFLFDHFPFYNKFRTVSMNLGIVNLVLVFGAALGIQKIIDSPKNEDTTKKLNYSFLGIGGLVLLFWLMSSSFFSFTKEADELAQFTSMFRNETVASEFYSHLISDRNDLFSSDAIRSLIFISLAFAALLLYTKNILNTTVVVLSLLFLVSVDVISIDKKYLTKDNFKREVKHKKTKPSKVDLDILASNKEGRRVFVAGNGMNESQTAYFHQSMGGYHPAKLRRYQDIADHHFGAPGLQPTINVLRMLNAGFVKQGSDNFVNIPNPLGHAWFVEKINIQPNPDSVMNKLYSFDSEKTAIINKQDYKIGKTKYDLTSNAQINQTMFTPNKIVYKSNNSNDGYAVFSEVHYKKGWNAYIDDKPVNYERVNYILRGLNIPSGEHEVIFKFEPQAYIIGSKLNYVFTLLTLIYSFGAIGFVFYKRTQQKEDKTDQ